ncbi:Serine/threonine-protein phosphatase 4 regulatory subunit 4 [Orchesella cincta]|uniref:Serine/threonine-protein phosphatase 4 regulatory subunit 4 n=1 Tax=Orchesella cincta TaxID=48709 RepID=A0A1D2N812_ORCCI|nr:Serine/threonine-protein phosphatase 4 regulatory subunit 4 [Orchesella cincta]
MSIVFVPVGPTKCHFYIAFSQNILELQKTPKLVEIGGAILYCEERLNQTTYYTVHQTMLEQFSTLPFCIPGDYIYSNFVPALFHRLRHMRQIPCRMAAANAIVIFLRHCRRSAQREDIRKRIKEGTVLHLIFFVILTSVCLIKDFI